MLKNIKIVKRLYYAGLGFKNPRYIRDLIKIGQEFDALKRDNVILPKNQLTYSTDYLYTFHAADFLKEPKFIEAYKLGKATDDNTLIRKNEIQWRIHVLCWAASHAAKLEGDFVDCGVYSGIFARAIIHFVDFKSLDKTYYLLDTFEGLDPKYSTKEEYETSNKGYKKEKQLYKKVKETFKEFNTKIIKGPIPETLSLVETKKVSFLSIDMNCVQPEVEALNFFWDKLVPGGIIVLDDYGYKNSRNLQKKAHDEFAKSKNVDILSLPTCQGLIIKP